MSAAALLFYSSAGGDSLAEYYTTDEAVKLLGVKSKATLYTWAKERSIEPVKLRGRGNVSYWPRKAIDQLAREVGKPRAE